MKNLLIAFVFIVGFQTLLAQDTITDTEKTELLAKSPFNSLYPTSILKSSDQYFASQMELFSKGAINEKNAHLIALGTSAATKCDYCIPYHISEAKRLGATDEEIKTAVLWKKKISTFQPDYCAQKLDSNPWIVQPFENYEEVRVEDLIIKHQGS